VRKIAVITGARSDYYMLYWIIKGFYEDPDIELQLIVTGMHLSNEFGLTIEGIKKDGFPITESVQMLLSSDSPEAIALSMGIGTSGFARVFQRLKPDIILVLGDRFEIFAAVSASVPFRIPVAHIHGGEITEGAMDELFRHAITKMSFFHFPTNPIYAHRIKQMGEMPQNIFCFGTPGLDYIHKSSLLSKKQLSRRLNIPEHKKWGIITYHPVTFGKNHVEIEIKALLDALIGNGIKDMFWIFTKPNADNDGRIIIKLIEQFVSQNQDCSIFFNSIGKHYLSLLKHCDIMIGNSSSGLIEAPTFELPVVNVSDRQKGRIRGINVIEVPVVEKSAIINAIGKALSNEFKLSLKGMQNPYGNGTASDNIMNTLKSVQLKDQYIKMFYDFSFL